MIFFPSINTNFQAVPFGLSTTMSIGLTDGQCVTIFWGWCLVSLISLAIASSLAEICKYFFSLNSGEIITNKHQALYTPPLEEFTM